MGSFVKGILGGFSGKVGNVIGSSWKGITYMRSVSDRRNYEPTERQIIQRAKFAFASKFLQTFSPLLRVGFRTQVKRRSPLNAAMADFMTNALNGEYPSYSCSYDKLKVAKGTLSIAKDYAAQIVEDEIEFTWKDNDINLKEDGDNYALLLAIGEGLQPSYSLTEFRRENLGGVIALPTGESGTEVHCYVAFAKIEGKEVSNSQYVGSVVLP